MGRRRHRIRWREIGIIVEVVEEEDSSTRVQGCMNCLVEAD